MSKAQSLLNDLDFDLYMHDEYEKDGRPTLDLRLALEKAIKTWDKFENKYPNVLSESDVKKNRSKLYDLHFYYTEKIYQEILNRVKTDIDASERTDQEYFNIYSLAIDSLKRYRHLDKTTPQYVKDYIKEFQKLARKYKAKLIN